MFFKDFKKAIQETAGLRQEIEQIKAELKNKTKELDAHEYKEHLNTLKTKWDEISAIKDKDFELTDKKFLTHKDIKFTLVETSKVDYEQILTDLLLDGVLDSKTYNKLIEKNTSKVNSIRVTYIKEKK